jgi:TPP-dependent pyruvate/acetoin dehydrogenase alpha subunit
MTAGQAEAMKLYGQMLRIRRFEESVLEAFPTGMFYGTTHTYLGQEANAVGVLSHLKDGDIVFSNHRCHGHFLSYGGDMQGLFAELMGKASGVSGGRGGSQHIHWKNFYSNGVLGSTAPVATGAALAEKSLNKGKIVVIFLGDGALGQGVLYESLNMASLWKAPILFVIENNHIAQTTPIEIALAGDIASRFTAFGIDCHEMDSSNVTNIQAESEVLFAKIRAGKGPQALLLNTHRFGPHSKGDDTRDPKSMEEIRGKRDPLTIAASSLEKKEIEKIQAGVEAEVAKALEQAMNDGEQKS